MDNEEKMWRAAAVGQLSTDRPTSRGSSGEKGHGPPRDLGSDAHDIAIPVSDMLGADRSAGPDTWSPGNKD